MLPTGKADACEIAKVLDALDRERDHAAEPEATTATTAISVSVASHTEFTEQIRAGADRRHFSTKKGNPSNG
jgi:hypothetical protein